MKVACINIIAAPRFRAATSAERSGTVDSDAPLSALSSSERNAGARLRQNAVDHVTSDVGQSEVATLVAIGQPLVIDPQ